MARSVSRLALAALLSLGLAGAAQAGTDTKTARAPANAVVDADPALWVIRDKDTTIYLFGTVHLLKPGLGWFDEAIADAFRASDELKLEILPTEDEAAMAPLVMELARDPKGRTMRDRLTPAQHAAYTDRMRKLGVPPEGLEGFEPWFVMMVATVVDYVKRGHMPDSGSEKVLENAAKAAGKPITAFETAEEQIRILDSMPEDEQLAGLVEWVGREEEAIAAWEELVKAWAAGDPDKAGELMNREMAGSPKSAKLLLEDRNRRWVATLEERMQKPGTVFVAVGAGHLMGDKSVQSLLKARGIEAKRIAY
jgi:uncharacterized protein YbaP (TraB family)